MSTTQNLSPPIALEEYRAQRRKAVGNAFATMQRARSPEASKRKVPRAKMEMPVTLHLDEWETDTVTSDVSAGGFAVLMSSAPTENDFRFALEIAPRRCATGHARIVAIVPRGDRFYVCLTFARLAASDRALVEDRVLGALLTA